MEIINNLPAWAIAIGIIILLINAVMWFFLPFIVWSMNSKAKVTNKLLSQMSGGDNA